MSKSTNKYTAKSNINYADIKVPVNTENLLNSVVISALNGCTSVNDVYNSVNNVSVDVMADEECDITSINVNAFDAGKNAKTDVATEYNCVNVNGNTNKITGDNISVTETDDTTATDVDADAALESTIVVERLKELGLLPTIRKLIHKNDLQVDDITKAAVSIHMLTDGLSEKQAVVVNDFDNKGVDLMKYVTSEYTPVQMFYIGTQLEAGIDVRAILNPAYTVLQMIELQKAATVYHIDVTQYANAEYSAAKLRVLRKACMLGVDIDTLISVAHEFSCQQLEHLVSLSFEGADLKKLLEAPKIELTAERLYATLEVLREQQDNIVLELTDDGKNIVTPRVSQGMDVDSANVNAVENADV